MLTLEFWYIFPIAILIATVAMATGVEGATFFTPLFILALGLDPEVAIATGLVTEVFGFGSGLAAYIRRRLIDYKLGASLLMVTLPLALLGTLVSGLVEPDVLKVILAVVLIVLAANFLREPAPAEVKKLDQEIQREEGGPQAESCLVTAEGEEIRYTVCNRHEGGLIAGIGALFIGMISTGQGEFNGYFLLQRCRVPSRVAVATSVFVVALTALTASLGHVWKLATSGGGGMETVASLIIFTIPAVILGGQLGPRLATRISASTLVKFMGLLFLMVGGLMLATLLR